MFIPLIYALVFFSNAEFTKSGRLAICTETICLIAADTAEHLDLQN